MHPPRHDQPDTAQAAGPGLASSRAPRAAVSRRAWLKATFAAGGGVGLTLIGARSAHADDEVLLEEARSAFNLIQITERGSVRTMYFIVDGRRYIESRWDTARPYSLDLDYSRTMMAGFLVRPDPKRIMMMGLGGGVLSNYLFSKFTGIEIDAVDIDPEVVRLAQAWFGVPTNDPRYRLHVGDGRLFVEKASAPWDMLILDAFRGVFVPFHLKTKQCYEACLRACTSDGVVVANLHNQTANYPHDRRTLAAVFPNRYAFVSELGNQTTFVASASARRRGIFEMRDNARALAGRFDFDLLGLVARYYMHRDWSEKARVLQDDFKPSELESAIDRHNETCVRDCRYRIR